MYNLGQGTHQGQERTGTGIVTTMWLLGTEHESSVREASAFSH